MTTYAWHFVCLFLSSLQHFFWNKMSCEIYNSDILTLLTQLLHCLSLFIHLTLIHQNCNCGLRFQYDFAIFFTPTATWCQQLNKVWSVSSHVSLLSLIRTGSCRHTQFAVFPLHSFSHCTKAFIRLWLLSFRLSLFNTLVMLVAF